MCMVENMSVALPPTYAGAQTILPARGLVRVGDLEGQLVSPKLLDSAGVRKVRVDIISYHVRVDGPQFMVFDVGVAVDGNGGVFRRGLVRSIQLRRSHFGARPWMAVRIRSAAVLVKHVCDCAQGPPPAAQCGGYAE